MNKDSAPLAQTAVTIATRSRAGRTLRRGAFWLGLLCPLAALSSSSFISVNDASLTVTGSGAATLNFPVTRGFDQRYDAYLPYETVDGTAVAGSDYVAASGVLALPFGTTDAVLPITVSGSAVNQPDKSFTVRFGPAVGSGPAPTFEAPQLLAVGSGTQDVIRIDLNLDGKPDIISANGSDNSLTVRLNTSALGDAVPSFDSQRIATETRPTALATADFNLDGRPDVVVVESGFNTIALFTNNAGVLSSPTRLSTGSGSQPVAVIATDLNLDGWPDLLIANKGTGKVLVLINRTAPGDGFLSFNADEFDLGADGAAPVAIVATDLNGDRRPDLVAIGSGASFVYLLNHTALGGAHANFTAPGSFYSGNPQPRAMATADLNGDGRPDLVFAHAGTNTATVLLNTVLPGANPDFHRDLPLPVGANPAAIRIADINADGRPDLLVSNEDDGTVSVLLNQTAPGATTSVFTATQDVPTGSGPRGFVVADLNLDGRPDLLTADSAGGDVALLRNTSPASLTQPAFIPTTSTFAVGDGPFSIDAADLNGTGRDELTVANLAGNSISTMQLSLAAPGDGDPQFFSSTGTQAIGASGPIQIRAADFNNDGRPDLLTRVSGTQLALQRNINNGGDFFLIFDAAQLFGTGVNFKDVTIADINLDGRLDLIGASSTQNAAVVLLNTTAPGADTFSFAAPQTFTAAGTDCAAVAVGDIDGDGKPDLVLADDVGNTLSVRRMSSAPGATTLQFDAAVAFAAGARPVALQLADVDGDQRLDVLIANLEAGTVSVLANTSSGTTPAFAARQSITLGDAVNDLRTADVDRDGRLDVLVSTGSGATLLRNLTPFDGSHAISFTQQTVYSGSGNGHRLVVRDLNGDGLPDFAITNTDTDDVAIVINTMYQAVSPSAAATGTIHYDIPVLSSSVSPASLDFGDLPINQPSPKQIVTVSNTGNAALTISGFIPTGNLDATNDSCSGHTLAVGESCTLDVYTTATAIGAGNETLSFISNAANSPNVVPVHYNGVARAPSVSVTPASLDFGNQPVDSLSAGRDVIFRNTGNVDVAIQNASHAGPDGADFPVLNDGCTTLAPGAQCTISFAFRPQAAGSRSDSLAYAVRDVFVGSNGTTETPLALSGTGTQAIASLAPASFDFGSVNVGSSSLPHSFTLTNSGNTSLTVIGAATPADYPSTNNCPTVLAAGAECVFELSFVPATDGLSSGTLTVYTNIGNQTASLSGTGVATQAIATLTPASFDFGNINVGSSSASHSFTLKNTGNAVLTVIGAATPADYDSSNNCPAMLAADAECIFELSFIPAVAGASAGTLTVYTSVGNQTAALSGTGIALSDTAADPIAFAPANGVARSTVITSDSITVSGINTAIAISVNGGSYALNGGAYTAVPGTVNAGDTVTVRLSSSPNFSTTTTATLTLGSGADAQSADFAVTTLAADNTPDAFAFGSRDGVAPSSVQTSNAVIPTGFNNGTSISVIGGRYAINGGAFTGTTGTINPGDSVAVQVTASDQFATAKSVQLTIGGVSGSFTVTTLAADLKPDTFAFSAISGVMPGSVQTSNTVTVSGINSATAISINGGRYRINGGAFTTATGSVNAGDTVTVRQTASADYAVTTTTTLTIGTGADAVSAPFAVTTVAAMPDPAAFSFGAVTGVVPGSVQTSGAITVSGTNTASAISVSGGSYAVNGGAFTSSAGNVQPGDQVVVRTTASNAFSTTTVVTLQIGTTQGTYSVTTLAADAMPDAFSFMSVSGVAPGSVQTSNTIVVSGINTASPISITGGQYRINDGAYTSGNGSVNNGDRVSVQKSAPADFASTAQATLSIGGVSASFAVTTSAADTMPDSFSIPAIENAEPGTQVSSETVLIGGINAPTHFTVSGACLQIGSDPLCINSGMLNPGDRFAVVVTTSDDYCKTVHGSVTVGGVTTPFTVSTTCTLPEVRVKAGGGSLGGGLLLVLGALALLRGLRKRGRLAVRCGAALAGLLLASTAPAQALDTNPVYGGLRLGSLDSNLGSTLQNGLRHRGYGEIRSDGGNSSFGGTLYVGYVAAPGVDFELGYTHADDPDVHLQGQLSPTANLDALLRDAGELTSGYGDLYSFAVRLPLTVGPQLSIAPRAGVLLVDSDVQLRAGNRHLDIHDRSGGYVLGADLRYRVWHGLNVGGSINYFSTSHGSHVTEYAALLEWHP